MLVQHWNSIGCSYFFFSLSDLFVLTEADAEKFIVGMLEGPFRVGAPFEIPLEFQDEFGHPTSPNTKVKPILTAK